MRILLILIMLLVLNSGSLAATRIIFVNGINVYPEGRQASVEQIQKVLRESGFLPKFGGDDAIVESIANLADGWFDDVNELVRQAKYSSETLTTVRRIIPAATSQTPEYREQLGDVYGLGIINIATSTNVERRVLSFTKYLRDELYKRVITNGDKVIVVAHSQGNFFTESASAYLMATATADERLKLKRDLRFVGVASVAASTPNDRYISAQEDGALALQVARTAGISHYSPLDRNVKLCTLLERLIPGDPCYLSLLLHDPLVHGFKEIYTSNLLDKTSNRTLASIVAKLISDSFDEISFVPPTQYTITPLGDVVPAAINAQGDIVGQCGQIACVRKATDGIWQLLGTFGRTPSSAAGINASGQIVGEATNESGQGRAFFYAGSPGSVLEDFTKSLPNIAASATNAMGISDAGHIALLAYNGMDPQPHAFLFHTGTATDLGTLPGCARSTPAAVNRSGTVVGSSSDGCPFSAFVKTTGATNMIPIPELASTRSMALAINESGVVAGVYFPVAGSSQSFGFLYSTETGVFADIRNGEVFVHVAAINNRDEVVGHTIRGAFVYWNSTLRDLSQLIPPGSGVSLDQAMAINDSGQIVVRGSLNGQPQGILLTPVQ